MSTTAEQRESTFRRRTAVVMGAILALCLVVASSSFQNDSVVVGRSALFHRSLQKGGSDNGADNGADTDRRVLTSSNQVLFHRSLQKGGSDNGADNGADTDRRVLVSQNVLFVRSLQKGGSDNGADNGADTDRRVLFQRSLFDKGSDDGDRRVLLRKN